MTREEAVKRIKEIQKLYVFTPTINEALDLAIEALSEPQVTLCKDCVWKKSCTQLVSQRDEDGEVIGAFDLTSCSWGQAEDTIEALGDAESATTTEDCISRQAVIDLLLNAQDGSGQTYEVIRELLHEVAYMPPVNQKQITGKLESAEIATSEGEESTMDQPKSKLYIPLNQHTVERINRLHKNDCGDYFDEEWLYNELEQIAEIRQLTPTEMTEWIPVSERLPEGYDQYLCYCEDGYFYIYWLDNEPWAETTVKEEEIIAWQPLPEPYKGGDTE